MTGDGPKRPDARYFAATDRLCMLSRSGTLDEVRELATQRAKMTKSCGVFLLDANGITLFETVFSDGTGQPPLFKSLSPEVSDL